MCELYLRVKCKASLSYTNVADVATGMREPCLRETCMWYDSEGERQAGGCDGGEHLPHRH